MVRKRSPDRAEESPRIDDLKLINGIGPAVEKRLNGVGIFTFAQLAALSPADIAAAVAGLSGLSSERIIKQDWIGQAHKLATEVVASEAQEDVEAPVEPPTPIERAQVAAHPVEPQQANKLAEAVASEAQKDEEPVNIEEPEHEPAAVEEPVNIEEPEHTPEVVTKNEPLTLLAAKPSLTGTLRGRTMEVIEDESGGPRRTLIHNKPFAVHLTLDFTEFQAPGNTPLNYKASIYGKKRGGPSGLVVGEAQGTIIPAETVTIKVEGNSLPEGIYHLVGTIIIGLPGMKLAVMPGTIAVIDGGQVQVL